MLSLVQAPPVLLENVVSHIQEEVGSEGMYEVSSAMPEYNVTEL